MKVIEWAKHKYIDKIKTRSGKTRYIYPDDIKKNKSFLDRDISKIKSDLLNKWDETIQHSEELLKKKMSDFKDPKRILTTYLTGNPILSDTIFSAYERFEKEKERKEKQKNVNEKMIEKSTFENALTNEKLKITPTDFNKMEKNTAIIKKINNIDSVLPYFKGYFFADRSEKEEARKCEDFSKEFSIDVLTGKDSFVLENKKSNRIDEIKKVNVNQYDKDGNLNDAYYGNCVRCVLANELRDRGYDVTAGVAFGKGCTDEEIKRLFNKEYKIAHSSKDITQIIKDLGESDKESRGYVSITYQIGQTNYAGGHIVSYKYYKDLGLIMFEDPQTGEIYKNVNDFYEKLGNSIVYSEGVNISRIDDAQINYEMVSAWAMLGPGESYKKRKRK